MTEIIKRKDSVKTEKVKAKVQDNKNGKMSDIDKAQEKNMQTQ